MGVSALDGASNGQEAAQSVAESAGDGLRQEADSTVEPTHSPDIHGMMGEAAVKDTRFDSRYVRDDLDTAARQPDQWPNKCRVCSTDWMSWDDDLDLVDLSEDDLEALLLAAIGVVSDNASPHHMYVPGGERIELGGPYRARIGCRPPRSSRWFPTVRSGGNGSSTTGSPAALGVGI